MRTVIHDWFNARVRANATRPDGVTEHRSCEPNEKPALTGGFFVIIDGVDDNEAADNRLILGHALQALHGLIPHPCETRRVGRPSLDTEPTTTPQPHGWGCSLVNGWTVR